MRTRGWLSIGIVMFGFIVVFVASGSFSLAGAIFTNPNEGVVLVNSATPLTGGNYDSYESPRGTDFLVGTGDTLYITQWVGMPFAVPGATISLDIGYGDTAVNNSAAPPTAATVIYSVTWNAADGPPLNRSVFLAVPSGKYPFVRINRDGNISTSGIVR